VNITIISTAYPLRGGIAHYTALLAQALGKRHKVSIVTFKRQYPSFLFPGKTQEEQDESRHPDPAPQLVDSINPWNWLTVGRTLRAQNPDLIIFKYWLPFFAPCFGTILRVAKHGTNCKGLVICDNVFPHEHRPFDKSFTRYLFSATDYFVVQSHAVEKELKLFKPDAQLRYSPHPVYDNFGVPMAKQEARQLLNLTSSRVLLFFGYVRRYKGLHILLEAIAEVVKTLDVHLLVVGEFYDDEGQYRKQIEELGIIRQVSVYSNYVPNAKVAQFFSAADAVVLPYSSATQSGIAQIAYNFDTPLIVSNVGGLAEVVEDGVTGMIVPPDDPHALAKTITAFYHGARQQEFSENVKRVKHQFTWDNLVHAIESLAGAD
jgi:glycosyltransferase involved in cell wall biosynthesis